METKRPFPGPAALVALLREESGRIQACRVLGALPEGSSASPGNQARVPLLASDPGTGREALLGEGLWPAGSSEERTRRAVGSPEPSQLEARVA